MAGARTQGVGRGVRWDAFGNIASLLARAGQARGEGYAALGAGIGGGINAFGANKRQEKRDAQAASEREAERGYRAGRDQVEDARYQEGMALRRAEFDFSKSDREADNRRQDALAMMAEKHREAETQRIIKQAETNVEGQELDRLMKVWALKSQSDEDTQGGISPETASLGKRLQIAVELNAKKRGVSLPVDEPQPSVGGDHAVEGAPLSAGGQAPAPGIAPTLKGATLSSPDGMFFAKTLGDLELQMQDAPDVAALSQIQGLMLGQVKQANDEYKDALGALKKAKPYQRPTVAADVSRAKVKLDLAMIVGSRAIKTAGEARKGLATRSAERVKQERKDAEDARAADEKAKGQRAVKGLAEFGAMPPERQQAILESDDPKWAYTQEREAAEKAKSDEQRIAKMGFSPMKRKVAESAYANLQAELATGKGTEGVWVQSLDGESIGALIVGYGASGPMLDAVKREVLKHNKVNGDNDAAFRYIWGSLPKGAQTDENAALLDGVFK